MQIILFLHAYVPWANSSELSTARALEKLRIPVSELFIVLIPTQRDVVM